MTRTIQAKSRWGILAAGIALLSGLLFSTCGEDVVSMSEGLTTVDYRFAPEPTGERFVGDVVDDIDGADRRVDAALSHLRNEEIAGALRRADERGVDVRIVSDRDHRDDAGFETLREEADVSMVFGDGEMTYLPDPGLSAILGDCELDSETRVKTCRSSAGGGGERVIRRPGAFNLMSHSFILVDGEIVWNFARPFDGSDQPQIGWRAESETLVEDFRREFRQLHGGVFASQLDAYSGESKTKTRRRGKYPTDGGELLVKYNPQERLIKELIDEIYRAKASVYIATNNISNPFVLDALEYKDKAGFDVEIIVHPSHQVGGSYRERLEELDVRYAPESHENLPTAVLIDESRDRSGRPRPRTVQILSHPLWHTRAYDVEVATPSNILNIYPSDLFVDGNLWEIEESASYIGRNRTIDRVADFWTQLREASQTP